MKFNRSLLIPWIMVMIVLAGCGGEQGDPQVENREAAVQAFRDATALADEVPRERALETFLAEYQVPELRAMVLNELWQIHLARDEHETLDWAAGWFKRERSHQGLGELYMLLFNYHVERGDRERALQVAGKCLRAKLETDRHLNSIGWNLVAECGWDPELGARLAEDAVNWTEPGNSRAMSLDTAGWGYFLAGDINKGAMYLEAAVAELAEPDLELTRHLVAVYEEQGRDSEMLELITSQLIYSVNGELQGKAEKIIRKQGGDPAAFTTGLWEKRLAGAKAAPDFQLTDLQGEEHTLSDLKGKVVLINFTAPT